MSESDRPETDFENMDGVTVDGEGNPQVEMETLEKSGKSGEE